MSSIKDAFSSVNSFTITLASLASSSAGVGRQSTIVDNSANLYLSALINLTIKMGTTPTANGLVYVYLIRDNADSTPLRDDAAGATDAGLTIVNAPLLGVLVCASATTGLVLQKTFDTSFLGPLGPKWGIAIVNASGVALNSTEGNHVKSWIGCYKTVA